jgi:hypothetical protein
MLTQGVHNKGVLSSLVRFACRAGTRDFCPVCYSRPRTKYLFTRRTLFHFIFPIVQQAGHAVVLRRLSLYMCLWPMTRVLLSWNF